jgi:hypothetical protein
VAAVEGAEGLRGQHGVGGPGGPAARRHVQHLVDDPGDRGDLMGDIHHGAAVLASVPVDDGHDLFLRGRVERGQRLVAQQQPGPAHQGLGDPEPLLLPAGEQADRRVRVALRADRFDGRVHLAGPGPRQAWAVAVDAELDQVAAADRQARIEHVLLRDVASLGAAPPWRPPVDGDRPGRQPEQSQHDLQQRGLARPVRAEDHQALTGCHIQVQVLPDDVLAEPQRGAAQRHRGPAAAAHLSPPAPGAGPRSGTTARPGSSGKRAAWSR